MSGGLFAERIVAVATGVQMARWRVSQVISRCARRFGFVQYDDDIAARHCRSIAFSTTG